MKNTLITTTLLLVNILLFNCNKNEANENETIETPKTRFYVDVVCDAPLKKQVHSDSYLKENDDDIVVTIKPNLFYTLNISSNSYPTYLEDLKVEVQNKNIFTTLKNTTGNSEWLKNNSSETITYTWNRKSTAYEKTNYAFSMYFSINTEEDTSVKFTATILNDNNERVTTSEEVFIKAENNTANELNCSGCTSLYLD